MPMTQGEPIEPAKKDKVNKFSDLRDSDEDHNQGAFVSSVRVPDFLHFKQTKKLIVACDCEVGHPFSL